MSNLELAARLKAVEQQNLTHFPPDQRVPFLERGENDSVWDVERNQYYDFGACFGVLALGHNPVSTKNVLQAWATTSALLHGMGDVYPSRIKVELLEELARLTGFPKGMLLSSGFEAVEFALKTAALRTGCQKCIVFKGAYHGCGYKSMHATDGEEFNVGRKLDADIIQLRTPFECKGDVREALSSLSVWLRPHSGIGAVLIEPIQARGGCRELSAEFLQGVREMCTAAGAVLIFDEIFCGAWRCATAPHDPPFVYQQLGIVPDLVCIGKGLSGGMPLAAVFGREEVMAAWPPSKGYALHTTTFTGHPLSCAIALATTKELQTPELQQKRDFAWRMLHNTLQIICVLSKGRWQRVGKGMLQGLKMSPSGVSRLVPYLLAKEGIVCLPAGGGTVVEFSPPFTVTQEAISTLSEGLRCYLETQWL